MWSCNELKEKRMKAAASFQVFRTGQDSNNHSAGTENPDNQENALAFPENLKVKSLFLKTKKMNYTCHNAINHSDYVKIQMHFPDFLEYLHTLNDYCHTESCLRHLGTCCSLLPLL
jgi:hypothetical protein